MKVSKIRCVNLLKPPISRHVDSNSCNLLSCLLAGKLQSEISNELLVDRWIDVLVDLIKYDINIFRDIVNFILRR